MAFSSWNFHENGNPTFVLYHIILKFRLSRDYVVTLSSGTNPNSRSLQNLNYIRISTHSNCHIPFTHYLGIPPIVDLCVARCNKAVNTACLPTEKNTGNTAFTTFTARVLLCARVCTWSTLQSEVAIING
jgi:hypothetical protein